jgi:hypothetical protein
MKSRELELLWYILKHIEMDIYEREKKRKRETKKLDL